jgi:hypothetical protein
MRAPQDFCGAPDDGAAPSVTLMTVCTHAGITEHAVADCGLLRARRKRPGGPRHREAS